MKRYKSIFSESKQVGILYHFTTIYNFIDIVRSGCVLFSSKESKRTGFAGLQNELMDYISFTRNFRLKSHNGSYFRFDIDGDKLSEEYKIEPFIDSKAVTRKTHEENEERIIKNKVNILDSLQSVTILMDIIGTQDSFSFSVTPNNVSDLETQQKLNNFIENDHYLKMLLSQTSEYNTEVFMKTIKTLVETYEKTVYFVTKWTPYHKL